jgi:hypothetical protein
VRAFTGGSVEEARFHDWQPVRFATVHKVSHGTAEPVLDSSVHREAFKLRSVEDATASVCS